jgi:hypothetical protein
MRSPRRLALAAFLLLTIGCGTNVRPAEPPPERFSVASDRAWFAERDALLAELSRREAQWVARRPPAYRVRAMWANMGTYHRGELVSVAGRPLVVCDTVGAPADERTREFIAIDIPELFQELRTALADTTHAVFVDFDPAYGFPASLQISERRITDTGYIRTLERFRAIPEDRARCAAI